MKRFLTVVLMLSWLGGLMYLGGAQEESTFSYHTRLTEKGRGIVATLPPADFRRMRPDKLEALPAISPEWKGWEMDLRSRDLRHLDLSNKLAELQRADFDSLTQWPEQMPTGYDPAKVMEIGKNPGLGVRALHVKGITGKGVGIGIIDQGLLVDHQEYADRLMLYEEIHCSDGAAQMHGPAVASIALGKTIGVAPEADLYYIATTHLRDDMPRSEGVNFREYMDFRVTTQAIDRLLEINAGLPKERKIRVISISVGWQPQNTGYEDVMAAVERAKQAGIVVFSMSSWRTAGQSFFGLGRDPMADPEVTASYTKPAMGLAASKQAVLLIPMDSRTTASPTGPHDYVFYRTGGLSWTAPYLAGVYALACQVKPDITPDEFWKLALETGDDFNTTPVKTRTREEIETAVAKDFDARIAKAKEQYPDPDELERMLAKGYSGYTGIQKERLTIAEARELYIKGQSDMEMENEQHPPLQKIVNPTRLFERLPQP